MSTQNDLINYKKVIEEANSLINEQIKLWGGVVSSIQQVGKVTPSSFVNAQKQVNEALTKNVEIQTKLDAVEKKRQATVQQTLTTGASLYKQQQSEIAQQERKRIALERATQRALEQNRAYQRLQTSWRNAQKALQDSIVTDGLKAQSTKRLQREFNDLDKRIKQVDAATKNYSKNVGNYSSAMGGLGGFAGQLSGALGIAGGIYGAVQLGREIYKTTKQLDLINKSMNATAMNAEHLASNMEFLNRVTEDSGLSFTDTAIAFNKFYAASKDKLELNEIHVIFDKISKAAALMGMSVYDQELIFLALEQMMSKGKVSSEELRRQLGERLPGAFDIMAKAVGVSTSELDDMMRKGEIISSEVLPKFADEVEKAFGAENIQKVENMAAAENRLSNAWTHFVDGLNSGQGTIAKAVMGIMDFGSEILKAVTSTEQLSEAIVKEHTSLNVLVRKITSLNANNAKRNGLIEQLKTSYPDFIALIENEDFTNENLLQTLNKVNDSYRDRIRLQREVEEMEKLVSARDSYASSAISAENKLMEEIIKTQNKYKHNYEISQENLVKSANDYLSVYGGQMNYFERSRLKLLRDNLELFQNSEREYNSLIDTQKKGIEDIQKQTGKRTEAEQKSIDQMKSYNATLEERVKIAKELGGVEGKDFSGMNLESVNAYIKSMQKVEETEAERNKRLAAEEKARKEAEKTRLKDLETDYKIAEQSIKNEIAVTDNFEEQMIKKYELASLWYNYELSKAKGNAKEIMLITEQMTGKMIALNEEEKNHAIKSADEKAKAEEKYIKIRIDAANKLRDAIREARASQGNISQTSIQIDIERLGGNRGAKYWDLQTKLLEDYYQTERDLAEGNAWKLAEIDKQYTLDSIKLQNDRKNAFKQSMKEMYSSALGDMGAGSLAQFFNGQFEEIWAGAETLQEKMAAVMMAIGDIVNDVFNAMGERQNAYFQQQFKNLETEKDLALQFAGENTAGREAIERQYEEKKRALQMQQAKQQKQMAMIQATINIAQGITAALSQAPPYSFILAALVGVLGAVQLATIASTPLPQFYKGTSNAPEGLALTQERGAEMITDKHGNIKTLGNNKGAQLTYLNKGDKVFTADETTQKLNELLISSGASPIVNVSGGSGMSKDDMREVLNDTLAKQPKNSIIFDESGIKAFASKENRRTILKNRNVRI